MHKKIFSNAGYLSLSSLIEKIGSFVMIPILTKALLSKDYGALMLASSYAGIVILFVYNGLHSALFRWYSMWQEPFDKKIYEKYIFYIVNFIGILLLIVLFIAQIKFNFAKLLRVDFNLFITVLISNIMLIGFNLKSNIWIIENQAYKTLLFIFLKTILIVCGVFFFIKVYPNPITKPIIEIIVIGSLSSYFIYNYFFTYPRLNSIKLDLIKPLLKESLIYGWGIQLSQIAFWVITSSDRIMLGYLTNEKLVAYYSLLMIGIAIMFIIVAFNNSFSAYYNKMVSNNTSIKVINQYIFTYLFYGFLILLIYKLFLYFFAYKIILIISTNEYLIISKYMYLTSDILLFYFIYLLFSRYLHAFKMVKSIIFITTFSAILNIILNYILIQKYEILGALVASIIAYFSMSIISFLYLNKNIKFMYMKNLTLLFSFVIVCDLLVDIILFERII